MTTRSTPADGREFVRMSVDIARHPKIVRMADPAAAWAWACAIAYCGEYHTDGWITIRTIAREGGISTQKARKLVAADLVHETGHTCKKCPEIPKGQAYLHDYLEHNRSKDEVEQQRRSAAEKGRKGAQKRWANQAETGTKTGPVLDSYSYSPSDARSNARDMAEGEEEITTHLGKAATEPNARETRAPEPERIPTGPGTTGPNAPTAWHAVRALIPASIPHTVRGQLAVQAQRLLDDGHTGEQITAALARWLTTPNAGPGLLPHLLADLVKEQAGGIAYGVRSSGSGARSARSEKVQGWAELGRQMQEQLDAGGPVGFAPLLIEGGQSA